MILIRDISQQTLVKCIDLYISQNDETFIHANFQSCLDNLKKYIAHNAFFRVIKDSEEVIGFILAAKHVPDFTNRSCVQQLFYASNQVGFKAAKCVLLAHNALIDYAEKYHIQYVLSTCSHLDNDHVFCKILQRSGWDIRGHTALWRTSFSDNPCERKITAKIQE